MQAQDGAPASPPQAPAMQDSVVGGDVHSGDIVHNHYNIAPRQDAPNHAVWVSTGLILAAILLATFGMLTDAWAVQEESEEILGTTMSVEVEMGLDDVTSTICVDSNCTSMEDDLGSAYDNCTSSANELDFNSSQTEEMCGELGDSARAGFTGMILISVGILVMLTTLIASFLSIRGTMLPYSQYYPFGGAGLILVGIVAWKMMLPEGDASLGYSAWITIVSIVLAAAAGGYTLYKGGGVQSSATNSRPPGQGARSLTSESKDREYVLRENTMGNQTISIVEGGKLLRLVCAKKDNDAVITEDRFITQKTAFTGFTHHRFDWLDSGKYAWWLITAIGVILLIFTPSGGSFLFLAGALLSLAQLFDPELLIFETNAGRHHLLLYRFGSNRELMNFSMDEIDSTMQQMLSGEQLDGSNVEAKAAEIEENRAAKIKADQEVAAAAELAKAVPPTPAVVLPEPEPPAINDTASAQITEDKPTPSSTPVVIPEEEAHEEPLEEQVVESEPTPKLEEAHEEPEVVIPPAPTPPPTPMEMVDEKPAPSQSPPTQQLPPPPPPVRKAAASPPAPPAPPAPAPAPPQTQALPPPPPEPPQVVQPGIAADGMPPPPPPIGMSEMAPDPFAPKIVKEPSSYEVEAAPREDSISSDEAIDLLQDLSE